MRTRRKLVLLYSIPREFICLLASRELAIYIGIYVWIADAVRHEHSP